MSILSITEPRPGVHFVHGSLVNWTIVVGADQKVTLVDGGYPADVDDLRASLGHVGRTADDIAAVILTHGHTDHQGAVARLRQAGHEFPVYAHTRELPNVRRDVVEQITVKRAGLSLLRPRMARWALAAVGVQGLARDVAIPDVRGLEDDQVLDAPGQPRIVAAHGHTSGHAAVLLPEAGVLLSGDALVTGHPTLSSRAARGHTLPRCFHEDPARNAEALTALSALPGVDVILPGHGPALDVGRPASHAV